MRTVTFVLAVCFALGAVSYVSASDPSAFAVDELVTQLETLSTKEAVTDTDVRAALDAAVKLKAQIAEESARRYQLLPVLGSIMELTYNTVVCTASTGWGVTAPARAIVVDISLRAWNGASNGVTKAADAVSALYAEHLEEHVGSYVAKALELDGKACAMVKAQYALRNKQALDIMYPNAASRTPLQTGAVEAAVLAFFSLVGMTLTYLVWGWVVGPVLSYCLCCCRRRRKSKHTKAAASAVKQSRKQKQLEAKKKREEDERKRRERAERRQIREEMSDDDEEEDPAALAKFAKKHKGKRR